MHLQLAASGHIVIHCLALLNCVQDLGFAHISASPSQGTIASGGTKHIEVIIQPFARGKINSELKCLIVNGAALSVLVRRFVTLLFSNSPKIHAAIVTAAFVIDTPDINFGLTKPLESKTYRVSWRNFAEVRMC